MHPALPDLLVGECVGMLQQEHADHEAHRLRWPSSVGQTSRQLTVESGPVDLVHQDDKLVAHVDDLIETGTEQIIMPRLVLLFRSHLIPQNQCLERITGDPRIKSE